MRGLTIRGRSVAFGFLAVRERLAGKRTAHETMAQCLLHLMLKTFSLNPLNAELNPICYLLAL